MSSHMTQSYQQSLATCTLHLKQRNFRFRLTGSRLPMVLAGGFCICISDHAIEMSRRRVLLLSYKNVWGLRMHSLWKTFLWLLKCTSYIRIFLFKSQPCTFRNESSYYYILPTINFAWSLPDLCSRNDEWIVSDISLFLLFGSDKWSGGSLLVIHLTFGTLSVIKRMPLLWLQCSIQIEYCYCTVRQTCGGQSINYQ